MANVTLIIEDKLKTVEVEDFANIAQNCISLYSKKNADYGNSFDKGMDAIGIKYGIGRVFDKCNRLVEITKEDKIQQIKDETVEDTLMDLACYSIMMLANIKRNKANTLKNIDLN